jgi:hypothetical protein
LLQRSSLPSLCLCLCLCLCLSLFNLQRMAMDRNSQRMLPQGMHAACIGAWRGCAPLKEREDASDATSRGKGMECVTAMDSSTPELRRVELAVTARNLGDDLHLSDWEP